jgi:hypothetical protein
MPGKKNLEQLMNSGKRSNGGLVKKLALPLLFVAAAYVGVGIGVGGIDKESKVQKNTSQLSKAIPYTLQYERGRKIFFPNNNGKKENVDVTYNYDEDSGRCEEIVKKKSGSEEETLVYDCDDGYIERREVTKRENENIIKEIIRYDQDKPYMCETNRYDKDGRQLEYIGDLGCNERIEYCETWKYDDEGREIEHTRGLCDPSLYQSRETWEYSKDGKEVVYKKDIGCNGSDENDFCEKTIESDEGKIKITDRGCDLKECLIGKYNKSGEPVETGIDYDCDGVPEKIEMTNEENTCTRDLNLGQESIRIFDKGCDGKVDKYTVTTFDEKIGKYRTKYYECDGRPDEYGFCPIYRKNDIRINSTNTNLMDYGEDNESSTNDY